MTVAALNTLINASAQNLSQFKGLTAAYGILLGGTPSTAGYTALINQNNTTNFGAGGTTVFNDENVYINTINALYQGNPTAKANFDAIVASASTIQDALTLVYNFVIPASARTEAGLNFFKGQATFFAARAAELGVAGTNGTALVAFASLTKIAVDNDIGGLGDTINDLRAAVANGTAAIPVDGTVFTPLETADGTQFDADDVAGSNQGQTVELKKTTDNIALTGTVNDTIIGVDDGTADETFNNLDVIDGGAGTADTMLLTNVAGTMTLATAATVKNVENLTLRSGANTITADVQTWTGLETVTVEQLGTKAAINIDTKSNVKSVTISGGTTVAIDDNGAAGKHTLTAVSLSGNTGAATIVSDALTSLSLKGTAANATVTAAGATRVLGVTLDGVTGGTIADATATGLTVAAANTASAGLTLTAANAATLAFSGDKTVSTALGAQKANLAITSTNSAGVTVTTQLNDDVTFTGGAGKDSVTVGATTKTISGGEGDDTVRATSALGLGGKLDGGAGTNTLRFDSEVAETLSATDTFGKAVENFQVVSLDQVATGQVSNVNLTNLKAISSVVSNGTAAAVVTTAAVKEVQTITITTAADADGGILKVGGVDVAIANNATTTDIRDAIVAQKAAILAANTTIEDVTIGAANTVLVTYKDTAGDVGANITIAQNPSGVTLPGAVTTATAGTAATAEQQTITFATAAQQTGSFTVAGRTVNVLVNDAVGTVATAVAAALNAGGLPTGIASATAAGGVVTITYTALAGDAPAVTVTGAAAIFGGGGVPTVADNAVAFAGGTKEVQTFTVTGSDTDGGQIIIGGVKIAIAGGLSTDQVGAAIIANSAAILAANTTIESVGYNTVGSVVTVTYKDTAGNVGDLAISSNDTITSLPTAAETTKGVLFVGTPAGQLNVSNMANNGTFELTGIINGASTVVMKDATGTADVLNIKLNGVANLVNTSTLTVAGVETININATDSSVDTTALNNPAAASTINLVAGAATKIVVTGNHGVNFTGSTLTNVVELDASGVVSVGDAAGASAAQIATTGAVTFTSAVTNKSVTVSTGNGADVINLSSVTDATKGGTVTTGAGNDAVTGTAGKDTVNLGVGNDIYNSSGSVDTITLGDGNDTYVLANVSHSVVAARDVITDFKANTFGQGAAGAVTSAGATGTVTDRTGDVINIDAVNGTFTVVRVGVLGNAADAQTFIQNGAGAAEGANTVNAALDSSSGFLYLDIDDNGVIDSVIELTGVSTINAAAFVLS